MAICGSYLVSTALTAINAWPGRTSARFQDLIESLVITWFEYCVILKQCHLFFPILGLALQPRQMVNGLLAGQGAEDALGQREASPTENRPSLRKLRRSSHYSLRHVKLPS